MGSLRCGPSWAFPHWDGVVYPRPKPRGFHPVSFLAGRFDVVEINRSFHQPLRPEISRLWLRRVSHNPNFMFTAKLGRQFTHERLLEAADVAAFKEGLFPLRDAAKLGCLLMQFPWSFRYTEENREFFIRLRRTFHEFPLVAEMRHNSWMSQEALGVFIDYHVGFCNIDQPPHVRAMPPTALLTSPIGYVRLHGRNTGGSYLYSPGELEDWKGRIQRIQPHAEAVFVITDNDAGGKSVVNALQLQSMLTGQQQPKAHWAPNKRAVA